MNFVDMEIYNRLYKEIVPTDEFGGTNLSLNPDPPGYAGTFYKKFAYKANGKIKIYIPFQEATQSQMGSRVNITLNKNGSYFISETVMVFPAGVFEKEVDVTPSDVFELSFSVNANTYVVNPGIQITAFLIDKIDKFLKVD